MMRRGEEVFHKGGWKKSEKGKRTSGSKRGKEDREEKKGRDSFLFGKKRY